MLNQNIQAEIKTLTSDIIANCSRVFDDKTKVYSMLANRVYDDLEKKSKEYIEQVEQSVFRVKQREKSFFTFETIKKWIFYGSLLSNAVILTLLIIFVFFKK